MSQMHHLVTRRLSMIADVNNRISSILSKGSGLCLGYPLLHSLDLPLAERSTTPTCNSTRSESANYGVRYCCGKYCLKQVHTQLPKKRYLVSDSLHRRRSLYAIHLHTQQEARAEPLSSLRHSQNRQRETLCDSAQALHGSSRKTYGAPRRPPPFCPLAGGCC